MWIFRYLADRAEDAWLALIALFALAAGWVAVQLWRAGTSVVEYITERQAKRLEYAWKAEDRERQRKAEVLDEKQQIVERVERLEQLDADKAQSLEAAAESYSAAKDLISELVELIQESDGIDKDPTETAAFGDYDSRPDWFEEFGHE